MGFQPKGISNLSQLGIDANKDWQQKNITNFGDNAYDVHAKLASIKTTVYKVLVFTKPNTLATGEDVAPTIIAWGSLTIIKAKLVAKTAPTGADLIVDINKNGTTIFTTQANRPKITDGSTSGDSGTPDVTTLAQNDKITVDIDQVGSTVAGADLMIELICEGTAH